MTTGAAGHPPGRRRLGVSDVGTAASPGGVTISRDGAYIAYDVVAPDPMLDAQRSSIWLSRSGAGAEIPRRLTEGDQDSRPLFGPLGDELAFFRCTGGTVQLFITTLDASCPRQVTSADNFPWGVSEAAWSPDGRRMAVLADVARSGSTPGGTQPIVVDRLDYFDDAHGHLVDRRPQVFVVDLVSGAVRLITDDAGGAGAPSWSPDGQLLAFTLEVGERPDLTRHRAAHVVMASDPTASPRRVGRAEYLADPLLWVDEGRGLVAAGLPTFDVAPARLMLLSVDGSEPDRSLCAGFDRSVMVGTAGYPGAAPALHPDGHHVIFCARDRGQTQIFQVPVDGGDVVRLVEPSVHVVSSVAVAGEASVAAAVIATSTSFGDVVSVDLGSREQTTVTSPGAPTQEGLDIVRPELRQFRVDDDTTVDAWILRAPETTGPGPLLLDVHGGPHNAWSGVLDAGHLYQQELADRGWTVVMPNPPGSDGYGDDFYRAVVGGWGTSDAPSLLAVVDTLVADGTADESRLAITGYSYGGFAVCHLTAMTDRFVAAVAGGLVCDFADFGASSDEGGLFGEAELGGSAITDRDGLVSASPISRVGAVTTPTLVLHGQDDRTCPLGQAEQWYSALATQQVPTQMVVYPGASHLFVLDGRPSHRMDYQRRVVDWTVRHASPRAAIASRPEEHWQARLDTVIERCGIPGAQLGILDLASDGTPLSTVTVASGVLHHLTGAAVRPDSLFQIGSISKIWTTVLVMQLVEEGLLDLDARVEDLLGLRVARDEEAATITVRQLLDHTSGIDGDRFVDYGRGDDCIAEYVAALADTTLVHRPSRGWSYCNAGWVVAGRIVEHLRGLTWDEAMRRHVIDPLGLEHAVTLPEEALLNSAAVGHRRGPSGDTVPVSEWGITRAIGPAGLVCASIGDLLTFAAAMMRDGTTSTGAPVLSPDSVAAMRRRSVDVAGLAGSAVSWGLGWVIENWSGERVYGHDGSTIGQKAYLRIFPERRLAIALLTNGGHPDRAFHQLFSEISTAMGGPSVPAPPEPDSSIEVGDLSRYEGSYRTSAARVRIAADGAALTATIHEFGEPGVTTDEPRAHVLHPAGPETFVGRLPGAALWQEFRFHTDEHGAIFLQHSKRRMVRA